MTSSDIVLVESSAASSGDGSSMVRVISEDEGTGSMETPAFPSEDPPCIVGMGMLRPVMIYQ